MLGLWEPLGLQTWDILACAKGAGTERTILPWQGSLGDSLEPNSPVKIVCDYHLGTVLVMPVFESDKAFLSPDVLDPSPKVPDNQQSPKVRDRCFQICCFIAMTIEDVDTPVNKEKADISKERAGKTHSHPGRGTKEDTVRCLVWELFIRVTVRTTQR